MPAVYHIDLEHELVTFHVSGSVDSTLLKRIADELTSDPQWKDSFDRLWDWREITELLLQLDDVKTFVEEVRQSWEAAPRVVIVARREIDLTIARLIKAMMRERLVEVFSDIEMARAYLDRAPATTEVEG